MKKLFLMLAFLILALMPIMAGITYTNSITYTNINGTPTGLVTNYGTGVLIGTARISPPNYALQHGALATTNDLTSEIQISFDNTNWTTIQVFNSTVTNDNWTDPLSLPVQKLNVYSRVIMVSTNSVKGGAIIVLGSAF